MALIDGSGAEATVDAALPHEHLELLRRAIDAYAFPTVSYDFVRGVERVHQDARELEATVHDGLTSTDVHRVRHGLANVVYWGYARIGFRDDRVRAFLHNVSDGQVAAAQVAFASVEGPALRQLGALRLPQFSQISFLSKIRMFLDPRSFVILDLKLAKLRHEAPTTVLHDLMVRTSIPASRHNERVYARWCDICVGWP